MLNAWTRDDWEPFLDPPADAMLEVVNFLVSRLRQFFCGQSASTTTCAVNEHRSVARDGIHGLLKGVLVSPIIGVGRPLKVPLVPFLSVRTSKKAWGLSAISFKKTSFPTSFMMGAVAS